MSSFLIYDPRPVYFTQTGEVAAGGTLQFFMAGTTTPQDVYGDAALTVNNGSVLTLGSDGRTSVDVRGDGSKTYRVRLYDANNALQFDVDNVGLPGGGGAGAIPALQTGQFLTNDGSQLLWASVRQLPDPTGQSGKIVSTDGTNYTFISPPADGAAGANGTNANVTVTASSVKWNNGTGDLFYIQDGSDSAPASGGHTTSTSVTFPVPFKTTPKVFIEASSTTFASAGYLVAHSVSGVTTTGFNVAFDTNSSDGSNGNIVSALPFDWIAFGTVAS